MNHTISTERMSSHVESRRAWPLLPDGVPGPVQHDDQWWAIPTDQNDYQPVTDPDLIRQLNTDAERFGRARQAARAAAERDDDRTES